MVHYFAANFLGQIMCIITIQIDKLGSIHFFATRIFKHVSKFIKHILLQNICAYK